MKLLKNRIFLSVLCFLLAGVVSFVLLPRFYENKSATIMVLRAVTDIPAGTELTEHHLVNAEVGVYGMPEGVLNDKTMIVGKVAQTNIAKGDYFFSQKLGGFLADEKLDLIAHNNQRLVTISVPSAAAGLSSHLRSGDFVTVAIFIDKTSGEQGASPIIYPELHGLEVYSVENARTQDTATIRQQITDGESSTGDSVPKAITLVVSEAQAAMLIEAEYTGRLHLIFEKRGVANEQ